MSAKTRINGFIGFLITSLWVSVAFLLKGDIKNLVKVHKQNFNGFIQSC